MPGKIVQVLHQIGDRVAVGDGLVVMEAMEDGERAQDPSRGPRQGDRRDRGTDRRNGSAARPRRVSSSRGSLARRRLLGLLLLLALGAWLRWGLPGWSAHLIGVGLQGLFNRPASVGSVSFHLLPLSVEIRDVWVQGQTPSSPPFIELPRAVAVPTLGPLWGRRIELSELVIEGLRVRIHAFLAGGDDIPRTGGGTGGGLELSVRRLVIRDGEFSLDHRRVPLELELPDFRGRLAAPPRGFLEGSISFGPGRLRFNDGPPLPIGTDLELTVEGRRLKVSKGRLFTKDIDLAYTGEMSLQDPPSGLFQLAGAVDLAELDHYVMRTPFAIAGQAQFDGFLTVVGSRLRLEGEVQGTGGMFDGIPVPSYKSKVAWNETGAHFSDLEVETLGGSGVLDLALPPKQAPRRLSGDFEGLDAEQVLEWLFDLRPSGLGASASGRFDIHWPRGKFRELTGEVDSDLSPRPGGRTPLRGRFPVERRGWSSADRSRGAGNTDHGRSFRRADRLGSDDRPRPLRDQQRPPRERRSDSEVALRRRRRRRGARGRLRVRSLRRALVGFTECADLPRAPHRT